MGIFPEGGTADRLRARHRAVVNRFLHSGHGDALLRRHELFCADGVAGLWTTDTGTPAAAHGREAIARYDRWSSLHFPDWEWYDIRIWTTNDPMQLWAECEGRGTVALPGHDPVRYRNHFLYSFEMRDGLIRCEREFMNPIVEMRALGLRTPMIDLGDFPG